MLPDPCILEEAVRRAQTGWLRRDERAGQCAELRRGQLDIAQRIQRLVDAYAAEVLTLEELRQRRAPHEAQLAALGRESQKLATKAIKDEQIAVIAGQVETFRARVSQGLGRPLPSGVPSWSC